MLIHKTNFAFRYISPFWVTRQTNHSIKGWFNPHKDIITYIKQYLSFEDELYSILL